MSPAGACWTKATGLLRSKWAAMEEEREDGEGGGHGEEEGMARGEREGKEGLGWATEARRSSS